jgi:hypothetical protein
VNHTRRSVVILAGPTPIIYREGTGGRHSHVTATTDRSGCKRGQRGQRGYVPTRGHLASALAGFRSLGFLCRLSGIHCLADRHSGNLWPWAPVLM